MDDLDGLGEVARLESCRRECREKLSKSKGCSKSYPLHRGEVVDVGDGPRPGVLGVLELLL